MNPIDAKIWVNYAESDLRAAYTLLESNESFPRQICFFGEQSAEKAIKAILIFEDLYFPIGCDLDCLRDLIPKSWIIKKQFPNLSQISAWSMESCYPGNTTDVTEDEAQETLQLAEAVFNAVSAELEERIQKDNQ